jgi:hypothetical protein
MVNCATEWEAESSMQAVEGFAALGSPRRTWISLAQLQAEEDAEDEDEDSASSQGSVNEDGTGVGVGVETTGEGMRSTTPSQAGDAGGSKEEGAAGGGGGPAGRRQKEDKDKTDLILEPSRFSFGPYVGPDRKGVCNWDKRGMYRGDYDRESAERRSNDAQAEVEKIIFTRQMDRK